MPYRLKKIGDKYKVCLVANPSKCFSKEPIPLERAEKQIKAIEASEHAGGYALSPSGGGVEEKKTGTLGLSDYQKNPNFKSLTFQNQLLSLGIQPDDYLATVKRLATKYKYDPDLVSFSGDGKHKLFYDGSTRTHFGAVGYGDFLIYKFLEKYGKVPKLMADKKREVFTKSHGAMQKKYGVQNLSANTLALRLLWDHF